jgi:hypothetical protein
MELYYILIGLYMTLGFVMFEWSWAQTKLFREVNESRDSLYPAYRRYDVKNWRKWKFYFGAITVLPLRFGLSIFFIIMLYILVK